jgi:hypothetical protein
MFDGIKFNQENKILVRNHLNYVKVEDPLKKFNILSRNDFDIYFDKD